MRKKAGRDNEVSALIDSDVSRKAFRKNWARLIQKIYNVDPLVCPRCHGQMRVSSFIEQPEIIEKILKHLDLWETRNHDPPARKATHIPELIIDTSYLPCSIKRNVSSILLFESAVKGKYHMTFDPSI